MVYGLCSAALLGVGGAIAARLVRRVRRQQRRSAHLQHLQMHRAAPIGERAGVTVGPRVIFPVTLVTIRIITGCDQVRFPQGVTAPRATWKC